MSARRFYFYALLLILLNCALPFTASTKQSPITATVLPGPDHDAFQRILSALPPRFQKNQEEWRVGEYDQSHWYLATRSLGCMNESNAEGWTLYNSRWILIRENAENSTTDIFWHEIGHAFVWPCLTSKERRCWESLYRQETKSGKYASCYAGKDSEEGFAETLRLSQTNPTALKAFPAEHFYFSLLLPAS